MHLPPASREPPLGRSFNHFVPAGRARHTFPIPVGQDELEGFSRSVFLDSSTSHVAHSREFGDTREVNLSASGPVGKPSPLTRAQPERKLVAAPGPRGGAMSDTPEGESLVCVADVEIDAVAPASSGFVLSGRGRDGADYRLEVTLEMPMNSKTRAVVAELLSQSHFRVSRRARPSLRGGPRSRKSAAAG